MIHNIWKIKQVLTCLPRHLFQFGLDKYIFSGPKQHASFKLPTVAGSSSIWLILIFSLQLFRFINPAIKRM